MRIEQITLQNLNSLAGSWTIDLSSEAYAENGIFAITGPTGAGKTTILDAITLALYGQTPRLAVFSQADNQIMSRGTGIASAAVVFSTPAGRYKAEWEQRRARKKPDGALQAAKVRLQQETSPGEWAVLAEQKRAFDAQIEKITGLNFAQFTRSVLLAQGNFSAFLKADVNTRADTLEKLTGTELYAEISKAVYARSVEEKGKLEKAQTELGFAQVLDDDTRAKLIEEKKALEAEFQGQEALRKDAEEKLTRLKSLARAREELETCQTALKNAEAKASETPTLEAQLKKDERATRIAEAGQGVAALREDLKASETQIRQLKTRKAAAETEERQKKTSFEAAETAATAAAVLWEKLSTETLPAVRALDKEAGEKREEKRTADVALVAAKTALDEAKASENALLEQKSANDKALVAARKWLAAHEEDKDAKAALPALAGLTQDVANAETQKKTAGKKLAGACQKLEAARSQAAEAQKAADEKNQAVKEKQAEIDRNAGALSEALGGRPLPDIRTEAEALKDRQGLLEKALERIERIASHQEALKKALNDAAKASTELEAARRELVDAKKLKAEAEGAVKTLASAIEKQSLIARLADERRQLEEGRPCPLCGSLTHPFCLDLPPDDRASLSAQRQEKQAEADAQTRRIEALTPKVAKLEAGIQAAEDAAKQKRQEITKEEAAVKPLCESVALPPVDGALREALGSAKTQAKVLRQQIKQAEKLEAENKTLEEALGALKDEAGAAREAAARAAAALAAVTQAHEEAVSEDNRARTAFTLALAVFNEKASSFGAPVSSAKTARALCSGLEKKIAQHGKKAQELADAEKEQAKLDAALPAVQKAVAEKTLAADQSKAAAARLETELKEILKNRAALFGDRDPETEGKAAEAKKKATEEAKKVAQAAAAKAANDLAAACAALDAEENRQKALTEKLEAELPLWAQALQEAGFESESDWAAARLAPATRQAMAAKLKEFSDRLTEAKAQQKKAEAAVSELEEAGVGTLCAPELEKAAAKASAAIKTTSERQGQIQQQLDHDAQERAKATRIEEQIQGLKKTALLWDQMNNLIGSANGMNYGRFVQGLAFDRLVSFANRALRKLTDRYLLVAGDALSLDVIDNWQAGAVRSCANLSGGESFIVSLALALGLSRMASRNARIESLFLDEGFGTLDDEALDTVLSALASLKSEGRLVGIISHVGQIEERIPARIDVARKPGGVSVVSGPGVSKG